MATILQYTFVVSGFLLLAVLLFVLIKGRPSQVVRSLAQEILEGELSATMKLYAAPGSSCVNCLGKTAKPQWTAKDATFYLRKAHLRAAIRDHKLCANCLGALAATRKMIAKSRVEERPGKKGKRSPHAFLKICAGGLGLLLLNGYFLALGSVVWALAPTRSNPETMGAIAVGALIFLVVTILIGRIIRFIGS